MLAVILLTVAISFCQGGVYGPSYYPYTGAWGFEPYMYNHMYRSNEELNNPSLAEAHPLISGYPPADPNVIAPHPYEPSPGEMNPHGIPDGSSQVRAADHYSPYDYDGYHQGMMPHTGMLPGAMSDYGYPYSDYMHGGHCQGSHYSTMSMREAYAQPIGPLLNSIFPYPPPSYYHQ